MAKPYVGGVFKQLAMFKVHTPAAAHEKAGG